MRIITQADNKHLQTVKKETSVAGIYGLTVGDLRPISNGGIALEGELAFWLSLFIYHRYVPKCLKTSVVTLLPKRVELVGPKDWRPIAVASTVRRLFSGILLGEEVGTSTAQKSLVHGVDRCTVRP